MADWVRQGSKGLERCLRERTVAMMEGHKAAPPPNRVLAAIQDVLGEAAADELLL